MATAAASVNVLSQLNQIRVKHLFVEVGGTNMLLLPGVVTSSPDQLTLPESADNWSSAILINSSGTNNRGTQIVSSFGQQLYKLREGNRVGVSLDASRNLQVHRDGVCLGVVTSSVPQPAHALFVLRNPFMCFCGGYTVSAGIGGRLSSKQHGFMCLGATLSVNVLRNRAISNMV